MADNQIDIKELLLKAKDNLEAKRKSEVEKRLKIYYDDWLDLLQTEIDAQFSEKTRDNVKQMLALDSNPAKRIIKETSIVYQKAAKRAYITGEGDTAKEDENYANLISQIPMNLIMQENNRLTNLNNENVVYIVPRNKRIEYDLLTANIVEVYQDPENSRELEAIVFTQTFVDTKGKTDIFYIYFDVFGNHFKFDADLEPLEIKDNPKGINPYIDPNNKGRTILPFVIFHKDYPIDSIWNVTGGNDIVSGTIQIGVLLTYLNYLIKRNTYKQLVLMGIDVKDMPKSLILDPAFPLISTSPEGEAKVLDYQSDLKELWELIYAKIGAMANNYGMSLDNFKITGNVQSGFALKIKNRGLEKIVEEQIKLYRWGENELFNKTQIINNVTYKDAQIADKGNFKIDFAEIDYPEDPKEQREQWMFDIKLGARSIADYIMSVNPDIKTVDEATKMIEKNAEINKTVAEDTGIDIAKLVEEVFAESAPPAEPQEPPVG